MFDDRDELRAPSCYTPHGVLQLLAVGRRDLHFTIISADSPDLVGPATAKSISCRPICFPFHNASMMFGMWDLKIGGVTAHHRFHR